MRIVTISRKRWLRGGKPGNKRITSEDLEKLNSQLYDPTTKTMCCLGFVARAAGYKASEIEGYASPESLCLGEKKENVKYLFLPLVSIGLGKVVDNSKICRTMMSVNDELRLKARDRESQLKRLARKIGIQFKFVA